MPRRWLFWFWRGFLRVVFFLPYKFLLVIISAHSILILFLFIFFTCLKKTNQKKGQPITWSDCVGLPCAPRIVREFENSHLLRDAQTDQTPFSVSSAVLGCVKRRSYFLLLISYLLLLILRNYSIRLAPVKKLLTFSFL